MAVGRDNERQNQRGGQTLGQEYVKLKIRRAKLHALVWHAPSGCVFPTS